ncbi:protein DETOXIFICATION 51 [Malania oleifera]|uniref:protein DETOXIFICATION 51 n=1 Tax=Malania oleifera TaxID=397392 RepID=UPI0025ADFE36|nr:protein DETOXIFICATION 51 [Malania oleifera]
MCNPNTSTNTTAAAAAAITPITTTTDDDQTHIFSDLITLPYSQKPPELQNHESDDDSQSLNPATISDIIVETKSLFRLACPIALTALILYSRSIVSMLFLGSLGDDELAAGSLAIAFANITGYSVLSGLALGMEPLCSQAFGARLPKLLSLTLHRSIIFLLLSSVPISLLWLNVSKILLCLQQDPNITRIAHTYLLFCLPDLLTNSFIHPIRIYLRAQGITHPLTIASLASAVVHVPINLLLVSHLRLGVAGVAAAAAVSNFLALPLVVAYVWARGLHAPTWTAPSLDCLTGWRPLIRLAAPSCVSVCLEWWWYEIMIIMCGLLMDPRSTVASMGVLIQTTSLIYVFPSSLGFAVSTRVGNELGANRPQRAKLSAMVSILLAVAMGVSATIFASGMRNVWARMFTNDDHIRRLTSAALPILGLCELGNCPQTVGCGVLRGCARPSTAANVNLGAFYVVGMPVAVVLGFGLGFGFVGLWLGLLSSQVCCAVLMLFVVGSTDWKFQAGKAETLTCAEGVAAAEGLRLPLANESEEGGDDDLKQPLICVTVTSP